MDWIDPITNEEESLRRDSIPFYENPFMYLFLKLRVSGRKRIFLIRLKNGLKFRVHGGNSDINSISEVFETDLYRRVIRGLSHDGTFVDVGANIGIVSIAAAQRLTRGHIFAFEPNKQVAALLKENIELNGYEKKIDLLNYAVAGSEGERTFYFEPTMWGGGGIARQTNQTTISYPVHCVSLEKIFSIIKRDFIDVLKIDVEGAEEEILAHASSETFKKIGVILLEYHEPISSKESMKKILISHGFRIEESKDFNALFATSKSHFPKRENG